MFSGAFQGMEEIINRRMNRQAIGFGKERVTQENKQDVLKQVRTEDLLDSASNPSSSAVCRSMWCSTAWTRRGSTSY
jgi:hypothetical protein